MKKVTFTLLIMLLISCDRNQKPINLIKTFFQVYQNEDSNAALDNIFRTNQYLLQQSNGDIENIKKELNAIIKITGNYCGYEIISHRSIGNSLIHYSCIVKYSKQPLRFSFMFYKANNLWALYNFKYDTNLADEIDDASKFYYIE